MRQNYTIYIFNTITGGIKYQCYLKVNLIQKAFTKKSKR